MKRIPWWVLSAGPMALLFLVFGIGNLIEDDGGPLYGQLVLLAVTVVAASAVFTGIRMRSRRRALGSRLIGFGVLPGAFGLALFWFPPAIAFGILAIVTSVYAFRDAAVESRSASVSPPSSQPV